MKPSSAKAKGRNFQNKVREMIMEKLGINEHDIKTAVMGESGMDIILSQEGRNAFPYAVECKKVERMNVWKCYDQACENSNDLTPLLVFSKNHSKVMVCFEFEDFLDLVENARGFQRMVEKLNL
tara:strand:+ start:4093 stop:4464 length:372 start_codon:yes stop_codon:yes gene_type:complete